MRQLTRDEFLSILRISTGNWDQLQYTNHVALAFNSAVPSAPGRYLDLDLVAMAIAFALTPTFGRDRATAIAGGFFNQWASAVGHAEAERDTNFFLAIGAKDWNPIKKRPGMLLITNGTAEQVAQDFKDVGALASYVNVNITDALRRLRARGREIGVDLSGFFFLPPTHPRFHEFIAEVNRERDERVARFRRDKKFRAFQARARREKIQVVSRTEVGSAP